MKNRINQLIRQIPGAGPLVRVLYRPVRIVLRHIDLRRKAKSLEKMKAEDVFTDIFEKRTWSKGKKTVSGGGSDLEQTEKIRDELPKLFSELNVSSVLDIPCGDFWWMKEVELGNVAYTGADIVRNLIVNNKKYETENIDFCQLDLITDKLPTVDMIFVRDCLVHLSFSDIFKALQNIINSRSRYLLTTSFTDRETNKDIATGQWRPLNLQKPPFCFPKPLKIINENHPKEQYTDKALALWEIDEVSKILNK